MHIYRVHGCAYHQPCIKSDENRTFGDGARLLTIFSVVHEHPNILYTSN